jgi:signal transduction histidine kinase
MVGFYPMVMSTSAFHIDGPVPGESLRLFQELISPAATFNPRFPLILNSEKNNQCDAFAGSYLEAVSGYLGGLDMSAAQVSDLAERFHQLGLDLLDLARIHHEAVRECLATAIRAPASASGDDLVARGKVFFAKVAAATSSDLTTGARVESLARQLGELALANRELREEVNRRKVIEDSLRHREKAASEMLEKSREMQEEWRLLSRRLLAVQEDEQKLISRELHDVIAQTMTGINVRLAVLRSQATANAIELHRKIAEAEKLAEKSVEIVHQFASELHPAVLDDFGLIPALGTLAESFTARSGVPVEIRTSPGSDDLPAAIRTALYRIAREALGNVARQSGGKSVVVSISRAASLVRMEISHAGGESHASDDESEARLGLLGMEERARMVGGTFKIKSWPGEETVVTVEVPLTEIFADVELKRSPVSTPSLT